MAVIEKGKETDYVIRCNNAYRKFIKERIGLEELNNVKGKIFKLEKDNRLTVFNKYFDYCAKNGTRFFINDKLPDGDEIQFLLNRVAINPINGDIACVVVIAGIQKSQINEETLTYTHIAKALSSDYFNLYYVNVENDTFVEYTPNKLHENLTIERHGQDFFNESRKDAISLIYEKDREIFLESFKKENILNAINSHDTFTLTYRLLVDGMPTYVSMKAIRMNKNSKHIIIGVNSVDAQMKSKETLERIKEERTTYARISALSGDYICIYTVDPVTNKYIEYSVKPDYEGLGLDREGEDFFQKSLEEVARVVYSEDLDRFKSAFSKENILASIDETGIFSINYRLLIEGVPTYVCLKIAKIIEKDGEQLVVGISNIDSQIKREQEYALTLASAKSLANIDALTGLKNRHSYIDVEGQLNDMINNKQSVQFAIVVCNINELKKINDSFGHNVGDEYIVKAANILKQVFNQGIVFRIDGDEFAILVQGQGYHNIDELLQKLENVNNKNRRNGDLVMAYGMAKYSFDKSVAKVFERAEIDMYKNKKSQKGLSYFNF